MSVVSKIVRTLVLVAIVWGEFESNAWATSCLTSGGCSGDTPICDLVSLMCRACGDNLECDQLLSGRVCATSGAQRGACIVAPDAGGCLTNGQCSGDTPVCDAVSMVCRGCGDDIECGAPFSGRVCANSGASQGSCVPAPDAGTPACVHDSDCSAGDVCDTSSGTARCIAGCHVLLGADSCTASLTCTALNGDVGTCVPALIDSGAPVNQCSSDADCSVGNVCDEGPEGGLACVVGCHVLVGGSDTCLAGTHCSVLGGGVSLGTCESSGSDASIGIDAGLDASILNDSGSRSDSGAGRDGAVSSDASSSIDGSSSFADSSTGAQDGATVTDGSSGGLDSTVSGDGEAANDAAQAAQGDASHGNGDSGDKTITVTAQGTGTVEGGGCACASVPGVPSVPSHGPTRGLVGLLVAVGFFVRRRRVRGRA